MKMMRKKTPPNTISTFFGKKKKTYEWTKGHESWLKIDSETEVDKSKEYAIQFTLIIHSEQSIWKKKHTHNQQHQYSAWQREMITHNLLNV